MSIEAILFIPPNGQQQVIQVTQISPDDEAWFKDNNAKLSMEEIPGHTVVYADIGLVCEGEPEEAIELSKGRTCIETMAALRKQCEGMLRRKKK